MSDKVLRIAHVPRDRAVQREQLIAYLAYAVDEVAVFSQTSALLVRMAIMDLEWEPAPSGDDRPEHKPS
jgi:hypothetical protein